MPSRSHTSLLLLVLIAALPVACDREPAGTGGTGTGAGAPKPASNTDVKPPAAPKQPPWFRDITAESGLDFTHDPGKLGDYFMPEMVGSGGAVLDFDNDGRLDLLLLTNAGEHENVIHPTHRLFRQTADGKFIDASAASGLNVAGRGMGAAAGDFNNDGLVDLVITEYGRARLFQNKGAGRFADISSEAGIDNPHWGTSVSFIDYDRDGWLDLVIVNYVSYDAARWCADATSRRDYCGPDAFNGTVTRLFRNRTGDATSAGAVKFEDVTTQAGLHKAPGPGLGVFCADFTGDRWPDIFVANDGKPNHLWINQKDGTFIEEGAVRGIALNSMGKAEANMGVAIGDVDGDGLFDLFVTHLTEENHTLWSQGPAGLFTDRTHAAGLTKPTWKATGFGAVFADFDNNGPLDLAIANGRVTRARKPHIEHGANDLGAYWAPYGERNQLFANGGSGKFADLSPDNDDLCGKARVCRGMIAADFNNDGALDLLATYVGDRARLFRNIAPSPGHWLKVRAIDPALKRDAYGAEITVTLGGKKMMRWINPGYSYLCGNDPRAHFGLGAATKVDAIHVVWPDGTEEAFDGVAADQLITLTRGRGKK